MEPETISMLCSPYTHASLKLAAEKKQDGTIVDFLVSEQTEERFPIRNGIPILYDSENLQGYNLKYNEFYRKLAKFYDPALKVLAFFQGGGEKNFRNQYLQLLEIEQGSRVLEVSVGTGANIALLPPHARYFGLDLSWEMLEQCQRKINQGKFRTELIFGNAEELPFKDEIFDVVFHVGGINAFNSREKAISEMIRVSRHGTKIVIVDETAKMMSALSWLPSVKEIINEWGERLDAPVNCTPPGMSEVKTDTIVKGFFYVLSFRKP